MKELLFWSVHAAGRTFEWLLCLKYLFCVFHLAPQWVTMPLTNLILVALVFPSGSRGFLPFAGAHFSEYLSFAVTEDCGVMLACKVSPAFLAFVALSCVAAINPCAGVSLPRWPT